MFQQFLADFNAQSGIVILIMADRDQKEEFLGGGPKFNTVGKDNRPLPGTEEPIVAPNRTGYWLRVAGISVLVLVLAGVLFYLNDQELGKTTVAPGHGVSPDAKNAPVPANLR